MSDIVVAGLFSLAGTIIGILASSKLTIYRIDQLEKKMDAIGKVTERVALLERDGKTAFRRIDELREDVRGLREGPTHER